MLFDARRLAAVWARRAKTLPPLERDRMLKRARFLAHMASWQWQHPNDSGTEKIDTTGPGYGFEQFKAHDFIEADKVVLTFDDGLWIGQSASNPSRTLGLVLVSGYPKYTIGRAGGFIEAVRNFASKNRSRYASASRPACSWSAASGPSGSSRGSPDPRSLRGRPSDRSADRWTLSRESHDDRFRGTSWHLWVIHDWRVPRIKDGKSR